MIDHIGIVASDFAASRQFYDAALAPLGFKRVFEITKEQTGGYAGSGYGRDSKPFFWLGSEGTLSSGLHVAFRAESRADVDAFYAAAMNAGGRDNGGPGLRPYYHPTYYGAFVLDPDGINVEAVCHTPE
ncbi:VOC family protein [Novosphingobium beihaiensis]|uniref:VOC family protein n=1 Tax=Novosphingobium beihaiensis TaxID=2930389 RepID=A0ABT0BU44_9SPHN|nr:VOC family protein [Novosphingobium beihaiensis]MCJ2188520.1 VOC family protein [Novosphingobium beihaiensis]